MGENIERPKKSPILLYVLAVVITAGLMVGGYCLFKTKHKSTTSNGSSSSTVSASKTASLLSWAKSDHPWPMFHGGYNHTGYADVTGPATNKLKWKYQIGGSEGNGPNSIVVAKDGTVFVAGGNKITALNTDGSLKWAKDYANTQ